MSIRCDVAFINFPISMSFLFLRDELVKAVYSDFYHSESGTLSFDQLPFFAVVGRLEAEKAQMLEERVRWRDELLARQADVVRVGDRMHALEEAISLSEASSSTLSAQLDAERANTSMARAEAKSTKDDLKRLRKELLRAKEDMQRLRQTGNVQQVRVEEQKHYHLTVLHLEDIVLFQLT